MGLPISMAIVSACARRSASRISAARRIAPARSAKLVRRCRRNAAAARSIFRSSSSSPSGANVWSVSPVAGLIVAIAMVSSSCLVAVPKYPALAGAGKPRASPPRSLPGERRCPAQGSAARIVGHRFLLFDFGGTLDADGVRWCERFHDAYRRAGGALDLAAFEPVFRASDRRLAGVPGIRTAGLRAMIEAQ